MKQNIKHKDVNPFTKKKLIKDGFEIYIKQSMLKNVFIKHLDKEG